MSLLLPKSSLCIFSLFGTCSLFFNFLFFIGVQLTNNAVLVSGIPEVIVFYLFSGKEN